uniref:Uncharacterized protein n=1 Tax=Anguilla anguilla TaxID=7936 RepID=A0A0E9XD07_ANGAN
MARIMVVMGMDTTQDTMATLAMIILLTTTTIPMAMDRATTTTMASKAVMAKLHGKVETTRTTTSHTDQKSRPAEIILMGRSTESSTVYPGGSSGILVLF